MLTLCLLAAAFSLLVRLSQTTGEERQQLKWFVYSTGFIALGFPLTAQITSPQDTGLSIIFIVGIFLMLFGFASVSIASAIAIFRYRLWDIDIIIRRTLIYGSLTVTLGLVFFVGIIGLQRIFGVLTGTEGNALSIVLSTLAIVALFNPLRRKVQDFIDRSFYRRKYDAEKIVEGFSGVVRDEVELEEIRTLLLRVVHETIQPESVSLWLKK